MFFNFFKRRKICPGKMGRRFLIPIKEGEISPSLNSKSYLAVDARGGKIMIENNVINPYEKKRLGGVKLALEVGADKVYTKEISPEEKEKLAEKGVEVEAILSQEKLIHVLERIKKENI